MTVEELKIEANKLGYNIIKKNIKPKILPCVCGCKRREHWSNSVENTRTLICKRCHKKIIGKNEIDVINNWNKEICEKD